MTKLMLVIGLLCGIFLLYPQWTAQQVDQALIAMGWRSAVVAKVNFAPITPPRR